MITYNSIINKINGYVILTGNKRKFLESPLVSDFYKGFNIIEDPYIPIEQFYVIREDYILNKD